MHALLWQLGRRAMLLVLICLLPGMPSPYPAPLADAHMHKLKWKALMSLSRILQETMLRQSLNRAQLNNGIVFDCRTTSDQSQGDEVNFLLQLGDLGGFRRLDPERKLALFLHGWNDEGSKEWITNLLRTWTHFDPDYNVCVVDWGHLSQMDYKTASMSIFDVGLTVAGIIVALERLWPGQFTRRNVTIAGYSLGAHAAGYAGTVLNGQLEQIIGLDPAGPLFTMPSVVSATYRLDASDARFVQVLHTAGGTLGSDVKAGHADFFPNGGTAPQRNCLGAINLNDMSSTNPIACSHSTAAIFFKESMDPTLPFKGVHCESYAAFQKGFCARNRRARFGIHSLRRVRGDFYFDTQPDKPYVHRKPARLMDRMWPARRLRRRARRWQRNG